MCQNKKRPQSQQSVSTRLVLRMQMHVGNIECKHDHTLRVVAQAMSIHCTRKLIVFFGFFLKEIKANIPSSERPDLFLNSFSGTRTKAMMEKQKK